MPSDDQRMLAALAHAGIVMNSLGGGGIIAAAVIWATQRDRSAFVARHALQALLFQGLGLLLTLLALLGGAGLLSFVLGGVAYALVAAAQAWRGQPFSYALVGRLASPPALRHQRAAIIGPLATLETPGAAASRIEPPVMPPPADNEP